MLPCTSCNLPGNSGGQPSSISLFGLAPDGVYQAFPVTWKTGALLPHRFTLTLKIVANPKAVYSLLHFPSRRRDSTLWSVLSCGVRTFLQVPKAPSDRLVRSDRNFNLYLHNKGFYCIGGMKSTKIRAALQYKAVAEYS